MIEQIRSQSTTIGDVVTNYRHYIHNLGLCVPALAAFENYFLKSESEYSYSEVRTIEYSGNAPHYQMEERTFPDPLALLHTLSSPPPEDLRIRFIIMPAVSQSSLAVIGTSLPIDPVFFLPHLNIPYYVDAADSIDFPVRIRASAKSPFEWHTGRISTTIWRERALRLTTSKLPCQDYEVLR